MTFAELISLIGIVGQLCINGIWLFRIINYDLLMIELDPWKKGLPFFIGSLFAFGFSLIGFLNTLNLTGSALFWMAGFLISLSAFFTVVEAMAVFKSIQKKSEAYIPKKLGT